MDARLGIGADASEAGANDEPNAGTRVTDRWSRRGRRSRLLRERGFRLLRRERAL
jgi:hypothetical protein